MANRELKLIYISLVLGVAAIILEHVTAKHVTSVILAYVGSNVTMTCKYRGLTQWTRNNTLFPYKKHRLTGIKLYNVSESDTGVYGCIALRLHGLKVVHTIHLYVGVRSDEQIVPKDNDIVTTNVSMTLRLFCESKETVTWFFTNDLQTGDNPAKFDNSFGITLQAQNNHSGYYYCYGRHYDETAFIAKKMVKVYDSKRFFSRKVRLGENAFMTCQTSSKLEWSFNGKKIKKTPLLKPYIQILNLTKNHTGTYECAGKTSNGDQFFAQHYLEIYDPKNVVVHPLLYRTYIYGDATINCYSSKTMTWAMSEEDLPSNVEIENSVNTLDNVNTYSLNIVNVRKENEGVYECVSARVNGIIFGDYTTVSVYRDLRSIFTDESILAYGNTNPVSQLVYTGKHVKINCYSTTAPKWKKDEVYISNSKRVSFGYGIRKQNYYIRISNATETDSGVYTCIGTLYSPQARFSKTAEVYVGDRDNGVVLPLSDKIYWERGYNSSFRNIHHKKNLWFYRPFKGAISKKDVLLISSKQHLEVSSVELWHEGFYYCYCSYFDGDRHFISRKKVMTRIRDNSKIVFADTQLGLSIKIYCLSNTAPKWYFNNSQKLPKGVTPRWFRGYHLYIKSLTEDHIGLITCIGKTERSIEFIAEKYFGPTGKDHPQDSVNVKYMQASGHTLYYSKLCFFSYFALYLSQ